ncbi:MAG: thrombospondin type 3 repeat-containing protein [Halorientalis sp.]
MPRERVVSIVAICVLAVTAGSVWSISTYKTAQETPDQQQLIDTTPLASPVDPSQYDPQPVAVRSTPVVSEAPHSPAQTTTGPSQPGTQAKPADRSTPIADPTTPSPTRTPRQRDYDGDGIPDSVDQCPRRPERFNGFQDRDGCPDIVATSGAS